MLFFSSRPFVAIVQAIYPTDVTTGAPTVPVSLPLPPLVLKACAGVAPPESQTSNFKSFYMF